MLIIISLKAFTSEMKQFFYNDKTNTSPSYLEVTKKKNNQTVNALNNSIQKRVCYFNK